jgi:hypothetical protein
MNVSPARLLLTSRLAFHPVADLMLLVQERQHGSQSL